MENKYCLYIYYVLFVLFILVATLNKPAYNWDMIGYVASAKYFETEDKSEIHEFAYKQLKSTVSDSVYQRLTASGYRKTIEIDKEALYQQLPFYQIRVLYNGLVYALYKMGLNPYFVTHLISAVSVCLGFLLLLFGLRKTQILDDYLYFALPLMSIPLGVLNVARLGTPDGLAFLFTMLIFLCTISDKYKKNLLWVLPLSILIRTDLIIFIAPVYIYVLFCLENNRERLSWLVSGLFAISNYLFINMYYANYGWEKLIYHTFINYLVYPADTQISISFSNFFDIIKHQWSLSFQRFSFWSFIGWMGFSVIMFMRACDYRHRIQKVRKDILVFGVISILYFMAHFSLFPGFAERHVLGGGILLIVITFYLLSFMLKSRLQL